MPEEIKEVEETNVQTETPETNPYIETIKELRESTVSKSEFEKVKAENKQLLNSVLNGTPAPEVKPQPTKEEVDARINQLRQTLANTDVYELNNLDFVKTALDLRNAIIDRDGIENDPFVGRGEKLTPTEEDYEAAQRVADGFQYCIDKAEGISDLFTAQLQQHTVDVKIPPKQKPKKAYQY